MSDFSTARQKMVDGQVRPNDVTDLRIIDAMLTVPRETFVPAALRPMAYLDTDLDLGTGGTKQFLIKPVVLARMLQAADIKRSDSVLVVGCSSGYSAAVLEQFVDKVTRSDSPTGEGASGPYDVIVLAGATEVIPQALYRLLAPGGRLVGVFAMSKPPRATLVTHSHDDFGSRALFDASVPVLAGLERRPDFVF